MKTLKIDGIVIRLLPREMIRDDLAFEATYGEHHSLGETYGEALKSLVRYMVNKGTLKWE